MQVLEKCEYCARFIRLDVLKENRDYVALPKLDPKSGRLTVERRYICRECIAYLGEDWHKHNPQGIYGVG